MQCEQCNFHNIPTATICNNCGGMLPQRVDPIEPPRILPEANPTSDEQIARLINAIERSGRQNSDQMEKLRGEIAKLKEGQRLTIRDGINIAIGEVIVGIAITMIVGIIMAILFLTGLTTLLGG